MHSSQIIPDTVTYNSLINGLCKKRALARTDELLQTMISEGHKPDVVTYTTLFVGLCKKGELEKAMELLANMISKGHKPNVVTRAANESNTNELTCV
jgi:pentatricopeptide repeat protein